MMRFIKPAVLTVAILFGAATARAGFTYSATPTPASTPFGNSNVTLSTVSSAGTLSLPTFINIADITVTSTTIPPATDTTIINFSDPISITNVPSPGTSATGTITVTGTLTFTRADSGGEISSFTPGAFTPTATIGGVVYAVSNVSYTPPTVNNISSGGGNISVLVAATVPEPASVSLLVLGGIGCLVRRRGFSN